MTPVELLSPAGNWDSLKAAVSEGADAVYLGVGDYNARRRAENFTLEGLRDVISYCHERGVRCYLALNTLVKNSELAGWAKTAEEAYAAGVDAVIIQDISFIRPLKASFPGMEVHVSTQAGAFNKLFGRLAEGADRVIMPRELTLNQVREFRQKTGIPVEVFVHGALCFSISGQCLMSSFLGGRSGNRGMCAQPCRKRYNGKYALSTADLCLVEKLPKILDAEVSSLKIEGRQRSAEYVGAATALYRRAIDSLEAGSFKVDPEAYTDLELSFSREFTGGGLSKEYDVVTPSEGGKRGIFAGQLAKGGMMALQAPLRVGDGVGIFKAKGQHGDIIREIVRNGKTVKEAAKGETVKLTLNAHEGDRVYLTSGVKRRGAYKPRQKAAIITDRSRKSLVFPHADEKRLTEVRLLAKTYSLEDALTAAESGASAAFYSIFEKDYPVGDGRVSPYVPRSLFDWSAAEALEKLAALKPKTVLCGDLGVASQIEGSNVYLDISCNAFNDVDVGFYNGFGLVPVVSPELTFEEMKSFKDKRFAVYAHGRIPLMSTKYALNERQLKDELGYTFPVRLELDERQVLNSVPLGLYNGISRLRAEGIVEYLLDLEDEVASTIQTYQEIISGAQVKKPQTHTIGHFKDGVE